jgi:hypothetical protein
MGWVAASVRGIRVGWMGGEGMGISLGPDIPIWDAEAEKDPEKTRATTACYSKYPATVVKQLWPRPKQSRKAFARSTTATPTPFFDPDQSTFSKSILERFL